MNMRVSDYYENSDNELANRYIGEKFLIKNVDYYLAALSHRYKLYPEIPVIAEFDSFTNKQVLEIGVGQGSDHYMFAKAGAHMSGIDLTQKHCQMTGDFLSCFSLRSDIRNGDACLLPFPDQSFDHVYSCGVLLLIKDIHSAMSEIYRVLRPGGTVTIMLYNKCSVHYWIKTRLYYGWVLGEDRAIGFQAVNDWCTDGPGYPNVYHYSPKDLRRLFSGFCKISHEITCLTPEQMPQIGLPKDPRTKAWLEKNYGFFLWGKAVKP